jgi:hypothetical protein
MIDAMLSVRNLDHPGSEQPGGGMSGRGLYPSPRSRGVPPRPEGRGLPRFDDSSGYRNIPGLYCKEGDGIHSGPPSEPIPQSRPVVMV